MIHTPVRMVARALRLAASTLGQHGAWTQDAWARDRWGEPVPARDATARSWCAEGALYRACAGDALLWDAAASALRDAIGERDIKRWNDRRHRTREHVATTLRTAARHLERDAQ